MDNQTAELSDCLFEPQGVTLTYTLDDGNTAVHRYLWTPDERKCALVIDIQKMGDTFLPTNSTRRVYIDKADVYAAVGTRVTVTLQEKMGRIVASDPERVLKLPVTYYTRVFTLQKKILDVIARHDGISFSMLDAVVGKYVQTSQVQQEVMDLWLKSSVRIMKCDDVEDRLLSLSADLQTEVGRRYNNAKDTSTSRERRSTGDA